MLALIEPAPDADPDSRGANGARTSLHPGALLAGKYRIDGVVAEGGMGVIYRGWHALLERSVAIKVLRPEFAKNRDSVARFLSEARAAAQLRGPHSLQVLDIGRIEKGSPYLVFELLEGDDLRTVLNQRGPLPAAEAIQLVLQACAALEEAHSAHIVHRDIKPENLFLSRTHSGKGVLKLIDFGIASRLGGDTRQSQHVPGEASVGSPHYMSPEQMSRPNEVDAKTDIWSLGVVLFELLTNETPFAGDTLPIVFARVLGGEPTPLAAFRADLPPELEPIIARCLAKKPSERFADVAELAGALAACSAEGPEVTHSGAPTLPPPVEDDIEIDIPVVVEFPQQRAHGPHSAARAGLVAACACAAAFAFGIQHQGWALDATASAVERVRSVMTVEALGARWVPGLLEFSEAPRSER